MGNSDAHAIPTEPDTAHVQAPAPTPTWQQLNDMGEIISELTSSMWPPPYFAKEAVIESQPISRDMPPAHSPTPTAASPSSGPPLPSESNSRDSRFGNLFASHPYSAAFLLGATLTASCVAGATLARYAFRRNSGGMSSTGHMVLAEFTSDCAARLSRLERLVRESHASQIALSEQANLLPSVQTQLSRIEGRLKDMDGWKVEQLHSRLSGVENNLVGQWRDVNKAFEKGKIAQGEFKEELERFGKTQEELMAVASRLDNFGKWSEVEVLNVLQGIRGSQEAALKGMKKSLEEELGRVRTEMRRELEEAKAEIVAANKESLGAAVSTLDSKNKDDWKVITDTLSQVENRLGSASGTDGPGSNVQPSGNSVSESIPAHLLPEDPSAVDGYNHCTVILVRDEEEHSQPHLIRLRYRSRWFERGNK